MPSRASSTKNNLLGRLFILFNNTENPQKINEIQGQYVPPLSKAHIRPQLSGSDASNAPTVEFVRGGSLLRSNKNRPCQAVGGGARGGIKGFSIASRRRLLELIACVCRDAPLPCFVTLTYPCEFPTVARAKRDLKIFLQRLDRKFSKAGAIWKLEPQQRGAPHYHLLVWGVHPVDLLSWVVATWYEIAGNGDINHYKFHAGQLAGSQPCVGQVRTWRGVWSYAAKYLGKTFLVAEWGSQWTGRFWGVSHRENIPFGEIVTVEVDEKTVVDLMRYQRRFMSMKRSKNLNSLKTFCNASWWATKVLVERRE